MAMASFCGMEIDTGLAESCLSLLRDRRNCLDGQRSELSMVRPRSVADSHYLVVLWTRHTLTMAGPWAALQSRGAVREACVGAISNGDYGWSRGRRVCTVQCAVCLTSRPTQR
jgi:hypothetical protein